MLYYLFDSSALVLRYHRADQLSNVLDQMYIQKTKGQAFFYFPNFCVSEVLNTFARLCHRDKKINALTLRRYCNKFADHIRNRKLIYCYNLNRYHNYNADEIYEIEHTTQPLFPSFQEIEDAKKGIPIHWGKYRLNAPDILVIAMGVELKRIHSPDNVYIVTNDERMASVSNSKPHLPKAIYLKETKIKDIPAS